MPLTTEKSPEKGRETPRTAAAEALELVKEGKARIDEEWYYLDNPPTAVFSRSVYIPATNENVFLGENRPSGVQEVAGTLRGRYSDSPSVYENILEIDEEQ